MKHRYITALIAALIAASPAPPGLVMMASAQQASSSSFTEEESEDESDGEDEESVDADDNQASVRENAVIDFGDISDDDIDIPVPSFINQSRNHIMLNGADWSALRKAFSNAATAPVSIVHIGDSHIQADINTATTRELLQYDFGNAGRGIISPLKMSGTNQPSDYTFNSKDNWSHVRLMSRNWDRPMGFTGASVHPLLQRSSITVGTKSTDDYNPFTSVTLFHGGKMTIDSVVGEGGRKVNFRAIPSRDYTTILMASQETQVTVYFSSTGDLTLYGASLSGNKPGLFYHAIGNNGATYATYNKIGNVGTGIAALSPNLVIVSLGTNEAFGSISPETFYNTIDRLVRNIRAANPDAQVLLVTPMECQRSVSRTVSKKVATGGKKRRNGKRSRRRTKTVKSTVRSYQRNTNIAPLRNEILRYGRDNNIAVLDWYEVAGGAGASDTWVANNLFAKDRVHHSYKGYHLQGRLLYDALIDALKNN